MNRFIQLMVAVATVFCFFANELTATEIYDTGGPLMPEQASYDVRFYDLSLSVNPSDSSIDGSVQIKADIVQPIDWFVVDLDTLLAIHKIVDLMNPGNQALLSFQRDIGKVWIYLNRTHQPGESVNLKIYYGGVPRIAKRPPWDGGFTWAQTADGSPWIATSCQGEGADIWWPVKDHVSDEPDSMGIHVRIPEPLVCASNGRLRKVEEHPDNTRTYHWFVSTPINAYNVALNIAPYKLIEQSYTSVTGEQFPAQFYVLPESYAKGKAFFPEILQHLRYFEETLGPYPFRADKYGVAQTPHLGMEHQSIIAYGANFDNSAMTRKDWGFDALHHHELSHEWWGNMVTNQDWRDMWLHEGFGTYMQALYVEKIQGPEMYDSLMAAIRNFSNVYAVAPRASKTGSEIYKAPIYVKGAWVLHSLRYLIGDEAFFKALRRMAYPDPAMEKVTDGRQCRFATTDDFLQIAQQVSGKKLDWFFEVYLRQPKLPELITDIQGNQLMLAWKTPDELPFPMSIDIQIGDEVQRVEIPESGTIVEMKPGVNLQIDPRRRILFNWEALESGKYYTTNGNYEKARTSFEIMLRINPENNFALNMMKHINYAEKNPDKLHSGFFEIYTGKYQVSADYFLTVTMEDGKLFIRRGRRNKLRIYPVSDNEFILPQFDLYYVFNRGGNGLVKELVAKSEDSIIKTRAKRVD